MIGRYQSARQLGHFASRRYSTTKNDALTKTCDILRRDGDDSEQLTRDLQQQVRELTKRLDYICAQNQPLRVMSHQSAPAKPVDESGRPAQPTPLLYQQPPERQSTALASETTRIDLCLVGFIIGFCITGLGV